MDLADAIEAKDIQRVKNVLASGADANAADERGEPMLILAIKSGQTEVAELLISRGANVNAKNGSDNGSTPLHWTAGGGVSVPNVAIAKLLLANGAEVDAKTGAGNTALIWAARSKEDSAVAVAELLLAHGADLNCQGDDGTPLHYAKEDGTTAMVDVLHRRRKASLSGNRNLGEPKDLLTAVLQFLRLIPPTPRCAKCRSTDVEHVENTHPTINMASKETGTLLRREWWECHACKHSWSIWCGTRGAYRDEGR